MTDNYYCPDCYCEDVVYRQWPAVDPGTGDHLGDWKLWTCPACDWKGQEPLTELYDFEVHDPEWAAKWSVLRDVLRQALGGDS
jgi:hypothetical protein